MYAILKPILTGLGTVIFTLLLGVVNLYTPATSLLEVIVAILALAVLIGGCVITVYEYIQWRNNTDS